MRAVHRRTMLGVALAGLATSRRARAQDSSGPTAPIQALNDGLIAVMRAGKATPFRDRFHMLTPTIDRVFDLPDILRVSVGLRWDDVDATQQAALLKVFRGFTVASYVANFDSYDGQRFEIAPALRAIGTDQVVSTMFVPTNGDSHRICWSLALFTSHWMYQDV